MALVGGKIQIRTIYHLRPVTSEIETPTFRPDVIIRSENLTVEIANTASEELLRKIRGLIHV